jgi:hypothetical protein
VNFGATEIANPATNVAVRMFASSGAHPAVSASHIGGFVSLFNGLIEQGGAEQAIGEQGVAGQVVAGLGVAEHGATAAGEWAGIQPAKRTGATPIAQTITTANTVRKQKEEKPAKTTESGTAMDARPAPPRSAVLPMVPQIDSATLAPPAEGPAIATRAEAPVSVNAAPTPPAQTTVAALPSSQSTSRTSMASGHARVSSAPFGSPRDLAFALRLTWQPAAGMTEAVAHSEAQANSPGQSSGSFNPTAESSTSNQPAARIPPLQPENSPPAAQTVPKAISEPPPQETSASSSFSAALPASWIHSGPESALQNRDGVHNGNTARAWEQTNVTTKGLLGIESRAENPTAIEPEAPASPFAVGPARSALAGKENTEQPHPPPAERTQIDQTDRSPRQPVPISGTARATGQETPLDDAESTQRPNPGNATDEAGNSEPDVKTQAGKPLRVPSAQNLAVPQENHDRLSPSGDGVLGGRLQEPGVVADSRSKAVAQPSQAPTVAAEEEDPPTAAPQALREVSLRLSVPSSSTAASNVDVQLAERAGKVQVAVRTADQDLARSLQGNLGELVSRLEEKGFKTDAWTPATAQHGGLTVRQSSTSGESQNNSDRSGSQGGQSDSSGQQQSDRRQQGRRWPADLENTQIEEIFAMSTRSPGASGSA